MALTLLMGDDTRTETSLRRFTADSFAPDWSAFRRTLHDLLEVGAIEYQKSSHLSTYQLTRLGKVMACHQLSLNDAHHLRAMIQIDHLAWLDLLLIAATSPDFPALPLGGIGAYPEMRQRLAGRHSTLLSWNRDTLTDSLKVTPEQLERSLLVTTIGYLVTRGKSAQAIADELTCSVAEVEIVTHHLRQRVAALVSLSCDSGSGNRMLTQRTQTLWHMLTGISPQYLSLMALPNIRHWVVEHLVSAGVTTLTALLRCEPEHVWGHVNGGLLRVLQYQARALLAAYPDEAHFCAAFTNEGPLIDSTALESYPIHPHD